MTRAPDGGRPGGFDVPGWMHALAGLIEAAPELWIGLGNLESRLFADEMEQQCIERPIFVCGLARAGSTIALELLAGHPDTVTHRYEDFPPVFTPIIWQRLLARMRAHVDPPAERSHGDGLFVNSRSPEAMEEPLWMAYFDRLHDPSVCNALDESTARPDFERFYRDHVRKLLFVRGEERRDACAGNARYLSKGNYNLSRIAYLHKLFPDARFVVPVREPIWHIASLMKQHALFCRGLEGNSRARAHLRRVGHFEFGPDRRPVVFDPYEQPGDIASLWASGKTLQGWARYWRHAYGYLHALLNRNPELRRATYVLRFESLCESPRDTLSLLFDHCALGSARALIDKGAARVRHPSYYAPDFDDAEKATIAAEIGDLGEHFGYAKPDPPRTTPRQAIR